MPPNVFYLCVFPIEHIPHTHLTHWNKLFDNISVSTNISFRGLSHIKTSLYEVPYFMVNFIAVIYENSVVEISHHFSYQNIVKLIYR